MWDKTFRECICLHHEAFKNSTRSRIAPSATEDSTASLRNDSRYRSGTKVKFYRIDQGDKPREEQFVGGMVNIGVE